MVRQQEILVTRKPVTTGTNQVIIKQCQKKAHMFAYTRAGLALNKLITAIEKNDNMAIKKALTGLIRFDALHIVDNFLGNLKLYLMHDPNMTSNRTIAAVSAIEILEELRPDIGEALRLRQEQAQMIDSI